MEDQLTRGEFDLLCQIAESKGIFKADNSPEYERLSRDGCIMEGKLTQLGWNALEPYRAKRAIFVAAGMGERLHPITINTPKPLVRVNGVRIIDTMIDACLSAGIKEIYIVRGYLGEQFDQLLAKYPMIRFLENDRYASENNISSLMCARTLLQNTYILEADFLVRNPKIICPYHYSTNYLGIRKRESADWCFITKDNYIICDWKLGGTDCWQQVGVSYWSKEDGERLAKHTKVVYDTPEGKSKFWDHVPLVSFKEKYRIEVRECQVEDTIEIDTFSELKAVDPLYNV